MFAIGLVMMSLPSMVMSIGELENCTVKDGTYANSGTECQCGSATCVAGVATVCIADLNVCKGEAEFTQDWCQLPHDNRNSGFFRLEHSTTCSMHEETVINGSNHMLVIRGQSSPLPTIERNQSAPAIRLFSIINGATLGLIQVRLLGGTLVYDSGMESHQKTFGGLIKLEMNRALPASSTCYIAHGILSNGTATEGGAIYAAVSDSKYWRDSTMMNLLPKACKVILRDTNVTDNKAIFYHTNSYDWFRGLAPSL